MESKIISEPGAAIEVKRIELTDAEKESLTIDVHLPAFSAEGKCECGHKENLHTPNFGCAVILRTPPCPCTVYRPPATEPAEPICKHCGYEEECHDSEGYCPAPRESLYQPTEPAESGENKSAHSENASVNESMEPLTEAEQKYLRRIFLPTPEEQAIEAEIDAVVEMVEKERTRHCELAPNCGIDEVMKAILKDRETAGNGNRF